LHDLDERAQRLEAKAYDTKPIWENALKEIAETRIEMRTELRKMGRKIDALNGTLLDVCAEMADFDNRLLRLEPETVN
jgi:predicted  nucleic acid-binding Zn-ribbon protein